MQKKKRHFKKKRIKTFKKIFSFSQKQPQSDDISIASATISKGQNRFEKKYFTLSQSSLLACQGFLNRGGILIPYGLGRFFITKKQKHFAEIKRFRKLEILKLFHIKRVKNCFSLGKTFMALPRYSDVSLEYNPNLSPKQNFSFIRNPLFNFIFSIFQIHIKLQGWATASCCLYPHQNSIAFVF